MMTARTVSLLNLFFHETLRTDANTGVVFVSRPSSSPLSKLLVSTTARALPFDEATKREEELYNQWMSLFYRNFPDKSSTSTDSDRPPLLLPSVEHGHNVAMSAEPVNMFQLFLTATASVA